MEYVKQYFTFKGCAMRTEFWIVMLIASIIVLIPAFLFFEPYSHEAKEYVNVAVLVTLWPVAAVQIRRWHDRNKSGWWILINFVPFIGFFWVLIENGFLPSVDEGNRFREDE